MAPVAAPSADLMDLILTENRPGRFRQVAEMCWGKGPVDPWVGPILDALEREGWLQSHERSGVRLLVATALAGSPPHQWPIYLALSLVRAGIPLAERQAFRDDPALRAAVDVAAARNP
jgi:hypothetical protein